MPPAATREPFARWSENSRRTALAIIAEREICDVNARFSELDSAHGSWSWLDGPHARVRYDDLSQLVRCEAATLAPAPYLSRFERSGQVVEVRLERLDGREAIAGVHDVTRKRRDRPSDALDLAAVLTGAIEMARTESEIADVRIEADVPPLPLVRGSAAELAHVFGSLLLHAREQMPGGGPVQVKARVDRGRVLVTIRDAGEGMNEEDLARLFDPFSGVAGETALGLSVAWGVMSRLGGSLQAQSHPGEGTAFTPTFPLAAPPRRQPAPAPRGERRTWRILIVDDEQDNLEVLREVLEMEDQRVESVRSGPDAIGLFERGERFDLVLCDVGMPQMSGWQVAREIQRIAPGTQIWMLTGWANEIGEGDPRLRYVHGVLAKPLDLDQLRSLLTTSPGPPAPQPDASTVH